MKKIFSLMLLAGLLLGFTSCDNDPTENEARTDFQYKIVMNDAVKKVLDLSWTSAGYGVSMTVLSHSVDSESDLPWNGKFAGKIPTMMNVTLTCKLKDGVELTESNYSLTAQLTCDVVTRDANGQILRSATILCGNPINKTYTKEELQTTFGDEKNPYSMLLGVDIIDGGSIQITDQSKTPGKYGTIAKG